jgi:hypothetical protein
MSSNDNFGIAQRTPHNRVAVNQRRYNIRRETASRDQTNDTENDRTQHFDRPFEMIVDDACWVRTVAAFRSAVQE